MKDSYRRWMHDWETRMTSRDVNRVVRPFEWGNEFVSRWPLTAGMTPPPDEADERRRCSISGLRSTTTSSPTATTFTRTRLPTDFRLEHRRVELFHTGSEPPKKQLKESYASFLRFTSAVESPYPENNLMNARWFPARGHRAVIVMPQWNADAISHNGLCQIFNMLGISALRMSMPYHDIRRPAGLTRADYAVSANIGRTIDSVRQGIADIRSCLDWLQQRGYTHLGWSAPAWARATRSSPLRTIRASASTSSTTPRPHSAMSRGPGSPLATSARASKRYLPTTNCAACGWPSAPSCTSTSSSAGPRSR